MTKKQNEFSFEEVKARIDKIVSTMSELELGKFLTGLEKWKQAKPSDNHKFKFSEKREHHRINASVYAVCETKNAYFKDFTKNVSDGGILIEPETTLPLHEDIFMTFFHSNFNSPVRANGKVVRVDQDGIGVQFDQGIPGMSSV